MEPKEKIEKDADLDSPDEVGPNEPAIRQFLSDKRHIRFEETDNNWEAIERFLTEHDLPVTVCSLALSYEQLSESGELELLSPGRERTPDEKTEGELKAEEAERTEPEPTETDTAKSARAVTEMFRKRQRGPMVRFKNGTQQG